MSARAKGLDAIESARPDGAARDTGFVRLRDAQQRGVVMAKRAAKAKAIETKAGTLTAEGALAAVDTARAVLVAQGWDASNVGLVFMWDGAVAGVLVVPKANPLVMPERRPGDRLSIVAAAAELATFVVVERADGSREAIAR